MHMKLTSEGCFICLFNVHAFIFNVMGNQPYHPLAITRIIIIHVLYSTQQLSMSSGTLVYVYDCTYVYILLCNYRALYYIQLYMCYIFYISTKWIVSEWTILNQFG